MSANPYESPDVAIIDYGMGNLGSVKKVIARLGARPRFVEKPDEIGSPDRIVLPGVGAFGEGMANLRGAGFVEALDEKVMGQETPFLGICLGMELMAEGSEESPGVPGLGWVSGEVKRFDRSHGLRVPHMGWNDISVTRPDSSLLLGVQTGATFYFVHGFYMPCDNPDSVAAEADYGNVFAAIVQPKEHVFGCQFHPEKSQDDGRRLMLNFLYGG